MLTVHMFRRIQPNVKGLGKLAEASAKAGTREIRPHCY